MNTNTSLKPFLSERVWPILRVLVLQLLLMTGIIGNLVGWLVLVILVDQLHWLDIDFHGQTLKTISSEGKILGFVILFVVNLILVMLAWRLLERKSLREMLWGFSCEQWKPLAWGLLAGLGEVRARHVGLVSRSVQDHRHGTRLGSCLFNSRTDCRRGLESGLLVPEYQA
jgi:hypothetical protein